MASLPLTGIIDLQPNRPRDAHGGIELTLPLVARVR